MRIYIVALFLLVSLVAFAESFFPKLCRKNEDCSSNECCLGFFPAAGKCARRGKEGEICAEAKLMNRVHVFRCPCQEGLECVRNRNPFKFGYPLRQVCVPESVSTVPDEVTDAVTEEVTDAITDEVTAADRDEVTNGVTDEVTEERERETDEITDFTTPEDSLETVSSESE